MLYAHVPNVCSSNSVSSMRPVANVIVEADDVLRYPPPYTVDDYISRYVSCLNAHRSAVMPVSQALILKVGVEEREKAYAGWQRCWKH